MQLTDPAARPLPGTPLLTTDYYFIYDAFGIYSSMNGALATWALLAGG